MNTSLVSIVTPSFNKGRFIEDTIRSVKYQTYQNIEHIIIDANSTDETLDILNRYDHVTWISEPDAGQSDAINKGWRMAKGDIIAYLNADDTYLPGAVASAVAFFETHPDIHMVYGDGFLTDENGSNKRVFRCGVFSLKQLVQCQNNILQPSVFLRKNVFDTTGDLDVDLHLAMDLDYWLRIALMYKIGYIPEPLSVVKVYNGAKSTAFAANYVKEYEKVLDKLYTSPKLIPFDVYCWGEDAYTHIYTKGGLDYLHAGMIKDGLYCFRKAVEKNPASSATYAVKLIMNYLRRKMSMVES